MKVEVLILVTFHVFLIIQPEEQQHHTKFTADKSR